LYETVAALTELLIGGTTTFGETLIVAELQALLSVNCQLMLFVTELV
jgi:hypothetical protein